MDVEAGKENTGLSTELTDFLFRHEYLFRQQVSMFYSLSPALMAKYTNLWNFSFLSANTSIDWNIATISRFEKHIDWSALSGNAGITWTEEILDRYKSNFNWQQLSANPAFPVTDKIIEKYTKYLNWIFLSSNPSIPIDDVFLDKHSTKINWSVLKNYNNNIDKISQKFQQKLIHLPESRTQSPFPLPDIVSRYIKWNVKAENLSDEFRSLMNERISQVSDFLFEKYKPLWYWRHISACIHLNWSIDFFERFYDDLGSEVTTNVAFYRLVLKPYLTDEIIDSVSARLNPQNATSYYYLEDKNDEYGMLPNVRLEPRDTVGANSRHILFDKYSAQFANGAFCTNLPEVKYTLSWFLRHPIRFADYHIWPIENRYPAIIISARVKEVLEQFNLPPHQFYKIRLEIEDDTFGQDSRDYYIFHVLEQGYLYYDYKNIVLVEDKDRKQEPDFGPYHHRSYYESSYFKRQRAPKYPLKINTQDEFLNARDVLLKSDPLKKLRPQEYIWNAAFDVMASDAENPRKRIWVSDDVKKALEAIHVEGIRFEKVWECRPRMKGVETPEHREKNAGIIQRLTNEYRVRAPEPEQITIINFKKAELWAERVRLNKGIVKKLRAGAPPVVLQDDFMTRIRQREEELDVVFPNWFVQIMECQQMPEGLEDYEIKTLESLKCYMISEDFPISVKSVVFAEYGTEVLFLALKKDSYYELDDIIYTHEYDQGPPPRIKMRMSLS